MGFNVESDFFCCNELKFHISSLEKIIIYIPQTRSYMIKISNHLGQQIYYCPWCGTKLPSDLSQLRSNIVFDELHFDNYDASDLPSEFRTDEWWKKRGL